MLYMQSLLFKITQKPSELEHNFLFIHSYILLIFFYAVLENSSRYTMEVYN